jgi:hypothetical protein
MATSSLVDELQLDAANPTVAVSSLLRKAFIVASKLGLRDAPAWFKLELSGYRGRADQVPPYRILHGTLKAKNPYQGWIPVQPPTADLEATLTKKRIVDSVSELETLRQSDGRLVIGYPPEGQQTLQKFFRVEFEFACFMQHSQMQGILDAVRNLILDWAISLERSGVKGIGMTFSPKEIQQAHSVSLHVGSGNVTIQNLGQSGGHSNHAAGNNAHLNINSVDNSSGSVQYQEADLLQLSKELEQLRFALLDKAKEASDYMAIGTVAQAETAAKEGNRSGVSKYLSGLGAAGSWVLGVAKDIGIQVAVAEIKSHSSLPPG